jgi:hypothetical protein
MLRYYDTTTKTETHTESETTIISSDPRVEPFFHPLAEGYHLEFTEDNLPLIVKSPELTAEELEEIATFQAEQAKEAE